MNDKIDCLFNEIVNLRLMEAQGTHLVPATIDMYKRRLVAIVVEECISKAEDYGLGSDAIEQLKEHFGVKE